MIVTLVLSWLGAITTIYLLGVVAVHYAWVDESAEARIIKKWRRPAAVRMESAGNKQLYITAIVYPELLRAYVELPSKRWKIVNLSEDEFKSNSPIEVKIRKNRITGMEEVTR